MEFTDGLISYCSLPPEGAGAGLVPRNVSAEMTYCCSLTAFYAINEFKYHILHIFFSFDVMLLTNQVVIGPVSENYPSERQTFARNDLRLQSKLPAKNLNTREETLTQFLPEKRFIHLHVKSFQRWMGWRRGNSRWSDGGFFFSFFFPYFCSVRDFEAPPHHRPPPASNRGSLCLLGWRVSAAEDTPSTLQLVWL